MTEPAAAPAQPKPATANAWLPYVLPMAVYLAITTFVEPRLHAQYVWVYVAKAVIVTILLVACRRPWRDVRPDGKMFALGAALGLVLCAVWVLGEKYVPYPHPEILGKRAAFNPYSELGTHNSELYLFLAARFFGLAALVPAMEEIFWRSFLLRYLTRPEFEAVPLAGFTWGSAGIMAALFGATHPEWLSAVIFAFAVALLLKKTNSLFACIVAHGVTNLALGVYVIATGSWGLW